MPHTQLTFPLPTAPGTLCSQSDTYFDSPWPSHCTSRVCAGCTWLRPSDIQGSGKRREVTASDKLGGQWERGRVTVSLARSNASVTFNGLWQVSAATPEAISCIWHMHLCGTSDWRCDFTATFLSELLLLVRLPPQDSQMHLAPSAGEFTLHVLAKKIQWGTEIVP